MVDAGCASFARAWIWWAIYVVGELVWCDGDPVSRLPWWAWMGLGVLYLGLATWAPWRGGWTRWRPGLLGVGGATLQVAAVASVLDFEAGATGAFALAVAATVLVGMVGLVAQVWLLHDAATAAPSSLAAAECRARDWADLQSSVFLAVWVWTPVVAWTLASVMGV